MRSKAFNIYWKRGILFNTLVETPVAGWRFDNLGKTIIVAF